MGKRLTRIYTRTGDDGTTGLSDGSRVSKSGARIEAIGAVDELNSCIGLVLTERLPEDLKSVLVDVQHDLFDLGGELSQPGHALLSPAHATRLERVLDDVNAGLKPLQDFILPGGTRGAAYAHLARTVCRRAERAAVALAAGESVAPYMLQYLNRLSDLLFVLARELNTQAGAGDVLWQQGRNRVV